MTQPNTNLVNSSANRRRRILIAVAAILMLAAVMYWAFTAGPGVALLSPAGSVVAEFKGAADQRTGDYKVREGWQIEWSTEGRSFAFTINGDRDFGKVIDQHEPGSGVTSPVGSGQFYLEVTADGPWAITIRQGQ